MQEAVLLTDVQQISSLSMNGLIVFFKSKHNMRRLQVIGHKTT